MIINRLRKPENCTAEYRRVRIGKNQTMRILIVRPQNQKKPAPGVLWLHGGGYATGFPEMAYMSRAIDLVTKCGAVIVCPDYRLSVKAPYPAAIKDCYRALLFMKAHCAEFGIRSGQIMVGGESAGGGLTAALCMLAKDKGTVSIAFQMPLYPMLDCDDTPSSADNHEKVWNTNRNHMAWKMYLRSLKGRPVPVYASPAKRRDYSGLPPAYTFVGDIEPFYCETLSYIKALNDAGVPAEADIYPNFYHAYDMMKPDSEMGKQAADTFVQKFREAAEKYFAEQPSVLSSKTP